MALNPIFISELQEKELKIGVFYEGEFDSGFLRFWSGVGNYTWDGKTWTGGGNLLGFSNITSTSDIEAEGFSITISGVPADTIQILLDESTQGSKGKFWIALFNEDNTLATTPHLAFVGRLDVPSATDNVDSATGQITYESILIDLLRPNDWRYTDQSQKTLYPGDRGFEYVTTIQDKELPWGRK